MLKSNVLRVTGHLAKKGIKSLVVKGYENPWRIYEFLEGYTSTDLVTNPAQAELVAGAFAKFQNDLADLPAPRLGEIIPKFHNTVDRLRLLDEAAAADVKGRKAKVAEELGSEGRILVRESGTEPVIRVMVEAGTDEICEKYVDGVIDVIRAKGHIVG
jgi:phosphomannomutase